jgi:hypothetical protein
MCWTESDVPLHRPADATAAAPADECAAAAAPSSWACGPCTGLCGEVPATARTYQLPCRTTAGDSRAAPSRADVFWTSSPSSCSCCAPPARLHPQRQTLVGHSYGGLVHAARPVRPSMFQRHVQHSQPSLWWGDGVVVQVPALHCALRPAGQALPGALSLHLSQGSEELAGRRPANRPANPGREAAAQAACAGPGQHSRSACGPGGRARSGLQLPGLARRQPWRHQLYACMRAAQVGTAWTPPRMTLRGSTPPLPIMPAVAAPCGRALRPD